MHKKFFENSNCLMEINKRYNLEFQLKPNNLDVLLSVEGVEIKFTGLLTRLFLDLKNNYFGWYDSVSPGNFGEINEKN